MALLNNFNNSYYYLDYVNQYQAFRRRSKNISGERKHVDISPDLPLPLPLSSCTTHLCDNYPFDYETPVSSFHNYFHRRQSSILHDRYLAAKYDFDYFNIPYADSCIHYKEIDKLSLPPILAGKVLLRCNELMSQYQIYELSKGELMSTFSSSKMQTLEDLTAQNIAYQMLINTQIVKERKRVITCQKHFPELLPVTQNTFMYSHYVDSHSTTLSDYFQTHYIYYHVEQLYSAINFAVYGKYQPYIDRVVDNNIIVQSYNHVILQAALAKFESSKVDLTPTTKTCKVLKDILVETYVIFSISRVFPEQMCVEKLSCYIKL